MNRMLGKFIAAIGLMLVVVRGGEAAIRLNEIFVGPEDRFPGDEGFGREFFELRSTTPNESLLGLWLLEINGTGIDSGRVDQVIDLGSATTPTTGANGMFLWRDDKPDGIDLVPNPALATVQHVAPFAGSKGLQADDNATYLLVSDFTGFLGQDLDTGNGGVLDVTPWAAVLDALGVVEAGTPGFSYASAFGGVDLINTPFGPDAFVQLPNSGQFAGQWFAFDSPNGEEDSNYYGPFFAADGTDNITQDGTNLPIAIAQQYFLTPGSENPSIVPEPSSIVLLLTLVGMSIGARGLRHR